MTADRAASGRHHSSSGPSWYAVARAGTGGGLIGGVCIWVYEAVVWVGVEHLMPLEGIPRNATGLVFGRAAQYACGAWAYPIGTAIHFGFAAIWGVAFAMAWVRLRHRGWEATMLAMPFAALVWTVMHIAITAMTSDHPNYLDPNVVIGGFVSHLFYTVPLSAEVRRRLPDHRTR